MVYRSFVIRGKGTVVASILFADDSNMYIAFSKTVAGIAKELILPSPFINSGKTRHLRFATGSRTVMSTGYLVSAGSRYDLDLLTEEVRFVIEASLGVGVKVRKYKSPDSPPPRRELKEEEKHLYEMAPLDVPTDLVSFDAEVGEEGKPGKQLGRGSEGGEGD